ncbi:hypothetical protein F4778DRAFT_768905 [Xylariomycetidae sp. FL2044]|nr:hypothetical protein F4778DRAFT_768905 [Xylariomycetidae sp. FL2044]
MHAPAQQLTVSSIVAPPPSPLCLCQSDADWATLNASVHGRLRRTTPLALPCFATYDGIPNADEDAPACAVLRANYSANRLRLEQAGGFMNLQDEMCLSDPQDQCVLDNTLAPAPAPVPSPGSSCRQGSVPSFHVEVEGASDVVAALAFAGTHGVPLVIKNSGHDYMMRSSQKGGLALWVHKLRGLEFHETFVPQGCPGSADVGASVTAGTGVTTAEVVQFAHEHGSIFVGGQSPTVAASGGWVLGGGHSVLSPAFGLGADRVVQFKIVTPDGVVRVANQCKFPDLFWALRGGGGDTFGVVLEATHRVEPSGPVAVADIRLPLHVTSETALRWIELMAREALVWGRQGWGGHAAGLYLTYMNPLAPAANLSDDNRAAEASMKNATDFALSLGGTSVVAVLPSFIEVYDKYVLPVGPQTAGTARMLATRLVPRTIFENEEGIKKLIDFMGAAQSLGFDPRNFYCPADTPYVADQSNMSGTLSGSNLTTSVHPAWYQALWSVSTSLSLPWNATYAERLQKLKILTQATMLAEQLTGQDGGSYLNEANPFTPKWRESWWGRNFEALLEIKNKYDPNSLLNCWKCIGFDETDMANQRFRCRSTLQKDIDEELGL